MSAITGYFVLDKDASIDDYSVEDFHAGVELQNHRGPSCQKKYGISLKSAQLWQLDKCDRRIDGLFGYNSLVVEGDVGDQPILSYDKAVLMAYDGEIYNFKELKEDLSKEDGRIILLILMMFH